MILTLILSYLLLGSLIWMFFGRNDHIALRCRSRTDHVIKAAEMIVRSPPQLAWLVVLEVWAWIR
jgi:hypothetical protein